MNAQANSSEATRQEFKTAFEFWIWLQNAPKGEMLQIRLDSLSWRIAYNYIRGIGYKHNGIGNISKIGRGSDLYQIVINGMGISPRKIWRDFLSDGEFTELELNAAAENPKSILVKWETCNDLRSWLNGLPIGKSKIISLEHTEQSYHKLMKYARKYAWLSVEALNYRHNTDLFIVKLLQVPFFGRVRIASSANTQISFQEVLTTTSTKETEPETGFFDVDKFYELYK